jgi:RNA polymerase sigma-70 factor (ECF subfamily)
MDDKDWLAERFEDSRGHLRAVAYQMLGSVSEADDAVQETWLRLSRSETDTVSNLSGWLTTVVARVSLDMLRSRLARREDPWDGSDNLAAPKQDQAPDPETEVITADSVGSALLVVLEMLAPAERLAFVLHDLFAVPFEEIAPIVGRSPVAARQLASRARRRVRGAEASVADLGRRREIVAAFLAASRTGDFNGLLALLDPDVVLRADPAAVRAGAAPEVVGADAVAETFSGRARHAELAIVDGEAGAVWLVGGKPRVVFRFAMAGDKVTELTLTAEPSVLRRLDWSLSGEPAP